MAEIRVAVTATTVGQLQQWAARWPQRRWAVEGAEGLGLGVAQGWRLRVSRSWMCRPSWPRGLACSIPVMPARPMRWMRPRWPRLLCTIGGFAWSAPRITAWGCGLLSDRRDDLTEERTRTANRLHALLRDLVAGGAKRNLTATHAAGLLRTVRPMTPADAGPERLRAIASCEYQSP